MKGRTQKKIDGRSPSHYNRPRGAIWHVLESHWTTYIFWNFHLTRAPMPPPYVPHSSCTPIGCSPPLYTPIGCSAPPSTNHLSFTINSLPQIYPISSNTAMNGRGGCCIARYAGGAYDVASKVDRIMLRFRPIAPKPASAGGFVPAGVVPESSQRSDSSSSGRKKRRSLKEGEGGSRVNKRCGGRKRRSLPEVSAFGGGETVVKTLPLLPETPDVKESVCRVGIDACFPLRINVGCGRVTTPGVDHVKEDAAVAPRRWKVAESWVRVERVTDRWVLDSCRYDVVLGSTDVEKVMSLDVDTCPGFVSDSFNNVRWINAAYKRMAAGEEVVVRVLMEDGVALPEECAAFTCRVRVVTCGKEKGSSTLPCDVWRMDCGGFAWRLDTKAALSLGW